MDRRTPAAAHIGLVNTTYNPPAVTHYVPAFALGLGHGYEHEAACGGIVEMSKHSDDPTCPRCVRYLKETRR